MNWPGIQTPFPISCNETCCKAINIQVPLGYTDSNLGNMVICGFFVFGFVYLLIKLNKSYQNFTLLRVYHLYRKRVRILLLTFVISLFVTIWFVLQALEVVVPMSALVSMIIMRILFIGHAMWDNFLVSIAFFPYSDKHAFRKAFIIACILTTAKMALMFTYSFDHSCDVCHLFFPAPQAIYSYLLFAAFYTFALSFMLLPCNEHRVRRAVLPWIVYLGVLYVTVAVATMLILARDDSGFCVMGITIAVYTVAYCPLLYWCFVRDTQASHTMKLRQGNINATDEKSPLMLMSGDDGGVFLRTKVGNAATVTFVDFEKVSIGSKIGVGAFGEVYKGKWNKLDVAVKRLLVRMNNDEMIDSFLKEVSMLGKLSHPNVVQLLGVSLTPNDMYILTEFLEHGSLFDYMHVKKIRLSEATKARTIISAVNNLGLTGPQKQVALDCAKGLIYLHSLNIMHRDLKTHNILLDSNLKAKLCDFGMARIKSASNTMSNIGTVQYMAPEVIKEESYSEKADIYSFGVVLWEIWNGKPPHYGKAAAKVIHDVTSQQADLFPLNPQWNADIQNLIMRCCSYDPDARPSFNEVVDVLEAYSP